MVIAYEELRIYLATAHQVVNTNIVSYVCMLTLSKHEGVIGPYSWKRNNFNPPLFQE